MSIGRDDAQAEARSSRRQDEEGAEGGAHRPHPRGGLRGRHGPGRHRSRGRRTFDLLRPLRRQGRSPDGDPRRPRDARPGHEHLEAGRHRLRLDPGAVPPLRLRQAAVQGGREQPERGAGPPRDDPAARGSWPRRSCHDCARHERLDAFQLETVVRFLVGHVHRASWTGGCERRTSTSPPSRSTTRSGRSSCPGSRTCSSWSSSCRSRSDRGSAQACHAGVEDVERRRTRGRQRGAEGRGGNAPTMRSEDHDEADARDGAGRSSRRVRSCRR